MSLFDSRNFYTTLVIGNRYCARHIAYANCFVANYSWNQISPACRLFSHLETIIAKILPVDFFSRADARTTNTQAHLGAREIGMSTHFTLWGACGCVCSYGRWNAMSLRCNWQWLAMVGVAPQGEHTWRGTKTDIYQPEARSGRNKDVLNSFWTTFRNVNRLLIIYSTVSRNGRLARARSASHPPPRYISFARSNIVTSTL